MPYANLDTYRSNASYASLNSHNLAYWRAGQSHKDTILFIHGFPSAAWDWHFMWEPMQQHYQVIALDLLGYGLSDKPYPYRYTIEEQARLIEALLQKLDLSSCHVVAHDYGDSVAQELLRNAEAGQSPLNFKSITFLNGGLFPEVHRPLLTQKLLKGWLGPILCRLMSKNGLRKSFTRIFGKDTPPKDNEVDAIWSLISQQKGMRVMPSMLNYLDERRVFRDRWLAAMQHTSTPLQFINGIEDPISGLHMLERYQELVPDSVTHRLIAGHYPQLELPQQVLEKVSGFISECDSVAE